jgi:hypothetical protein
VYGVEVVYCNCVDHSKDQWWAFVKMVMKFRVQESPEIDWSAESVFEEVF